MRCDLGVMISASHNPYDDNGIKLFGPDGAKLSDETEAEIEDADRRRSRRSARRRRMHSAAPGASTASPTATSNTPSAPCRARLSLDGLRVVIDCANGAGYRVAPEALWELGAEVISLGVDPDGFNINRDVGSTAPEALAAKVREVRADIGIALDGDADRVVVVDERGQLIDGDQMMAAIATSWAEEGLLAKPGIVVTVMSNLGLERYLAGIGLGLVRTPVGDRYVAEAMRARGLQSRRRAVRPHHPVRLHHDRRRSRRRPSAARRGAQAAGGRSARSATCSSRCRRS